VVGRARSRPLRPVRVRRAEPAPAAASPALGVAAVLTGASRAAVRVLVGVRTGRVMAGAIRRSRLRRTAANSSRSHRTSRQPMAVRENRLSRPRQLKVACLLMVPSPGSRLSPAAPGRLVRPLMVGVSPVSRVARQNRRPVHPPRPPRRLISRSRAPRVSVRRASPLRRARRARVASR
jgi:hypothetical protein